MTTPSSHRRLKSVAASVAPERLYWSILDPPPGTRIRPGVLPLGLLAAFAEDVPLPDGLLEAAALAPAEALDAPSAALSSSDLHVVCTPFGDGRILACGAAAGAFDSESGVECPALYPAHLPMFVLDELAVVVGRGGGSQALSAEAVRLAGTLNLLVGVLEPAPQRAARSRRRRLVLVTLLAVAMFCAAGLERRIRHHHQLALAATARAGVIAQELGKSVRSPVRVTPDTLPGLRAAAQRSAQAAARVAVAGDAAAALASLLAAWPGQGPADGHNGGEVKNWSCEIQSLGVGGDTAAVTLLVEGDAAAFLRALRPPQGWSMLEPRLANVSQPRDTARPASASDAADFVGPALPGSRVAPALTRLALELRRAGQSHTMGGSP